VSSKSAKIRMTIVLENTLYFAFHEKTQEAGATHNGIVRKLIKAWVAPVDPTIPPPPKRK